MVELRSSTHLNSHLHSIRTIKDKSIKILHVRGKSKLKFRQLVDLYNLEHRKDDESIPRVVRDVSNMTQGSCLFGAEVDIKTNPEDFCMTLEKIRKQCKEKKRKRRNCRDTETASNVDVKQEYLTQDEECDLEEPLSSWNTKFSKRRKKNQERKAKRCSTSSPSVEKVDLPVFFDIKPEAWDDSYSVSEAILESTTDTVLVEETICDSSKDTRLAECCGEERNSPELVAIAEPIATEPVEMAFENASEEINDARKAQCSIEKDLVLHGSGSREEIELDIPQHSESEITNCVENLVRFDTSLLCEEVEEDEESNDSTPISVMSQTGLDIVKSEAPDILTTDLSDLPNIDFRVEHTKIVFETEDISKDDLPDATDILQLYNLQPVADGSTISLEEIRLPETLQKISSPNHEDEVGDDKASQLNEAPNEVKTVPETDNIQHHNLHQQPEKLLSGRKEALSPTSQAKLCKAMEQPDSPEKRSKQTKGKLYFSNYSHRILKAEGLKNMDRVDIIPSSKQIIRKANNSTRQRQYQRPAHKFPRRDTRASKSQPFSTGSASIQGCSQKAITFAQGQMRDFQHVAANLTKELKTMRQITKRCLLAENNPSNMSDCDLDEVKTMIGNAERTEESSKKLLSVLERDCNRFCKLMGMVGEESPAIENIVQKKKKINFADDAGGDLCHIKVFEIDLESES